MNPAEPAADKAILTSFVPEVPAAPERVALLPESIRRDAQSAVLRVGDCERDERQPRKALTGLDELARSIRAHGLINAILVRRHPDAAGKYLVVAGERRWRACVLAGLEQVSARVLDRDLSDRERRALQFAENNDRSALNLLEEGLFFQEEKQARGCSNRELAKALGLDKSYVDSRLRLLTLPEDVRECLRSGRIDSPSAADRLTRIADPEELRLAVAGLVAGTLKPTALRARPKEKKGGPLKSKRRTIAGVTISVSSSRRVTYAQWKEALERFIAGELGPETRPDARAA